MSHRHYCDIAGHGWQCSSRECMCICAVPMHTGDHRECPVELRACPKHRERPRFESAQSTKRRETKSRKSGSVYGRIKMPPMHRVLRAARRASRPGFGAACVWCGHAYRLGEYSPEAQDAHLLACPSYPEDGKQQIQQMQERRAAAKRTSR
jgi:hypothetical protein